MERPLTDVLEGQKRRNDLVLCRSGPVTAPVAVVLTVRCGACSERREALSGGRGRCRPDQQGRAADGGDGDGAAGEESGLRPPPPPSATARRGRARSRAARGARRRTPGRPIRRLDRGRGVGLVGGTQQRVQRRVLGHHAPPREGPRPSPAGHPTGTAGRRRPRPAPIPGSGRACSGPRWSAASRRARVHYLIPVWRKGSRRAGAGAVRCRRCRVGHRWATGTPGMTPAVAGILARRRPRSADVRVRCGGTLGTDFQERGRPVEHEAPPV